VRSTAASDVRDRGDIPCIVAAASRRGQGETHRRGEVRLECGENRRFGFSFSPVGGLCPSTGATPGVSFGAGAYRCGVGLRCGLQAGPSRQPGAAEGARILLWVFPLTPCNQTERLQTECNPKEALQPKSSRPPSRRAWPLVPDNLPRADRGFSPLLRAVPGGTDRWRAGGAARCSRSPSEPSGSRASLSLTCVSFHPPHKLGQRVKRIPCCLPGQPSSRQGAHRPLRVPARPIRFTRKGDLRRAAARLLQANHFVRTSPFP
jgi:hypothetical protein